MDYVRGLSPFLLPTCHFLISRTLKKSTTFTNQSNISLCVPTNRLEVRDTACASPPSFAIHLRVFYRCLPFSRHPDSVGGYANFGIFEVYNDPLLDNLLKCICTLLFNLDISVACVRHLLKYVSLNLAQLCVAVP